MRYAKWEIKRFEEICAPLQYKFPFLLSKKEKLKARMTDLKITLLDVKEISNY
jgi:hypothetical protein